MNELKPTFGCVVLTQGDRPAQLKAAIASLLGQVDVQVAGDGRADRRAEARARRLQAP